MNDKVAQCIFHRSPHPRLQAHRDRQSDIVSLIRLAKLHNSCSYNIYMYYVLTKYSPSMTACKNNVNCFLQNDK